MLLVETEVRTSERHGLGVFTTHDIAKGTMIWQFNPIVDRIIFKDDVKDLPKHMINHLQHHAYIDVNKNYVIALDNNQYSNHDYEPNLVWDDNECGWRASHDIAADEELTKDYQDFYTYDISGILKRTSNDSS